MAVCEHRARGGWLGWEEAAEGRCCHGNAERRQAGLPGSRQQRPHRGLGPRASGAEKMKSCGFGHPVCGALSQRRELAAGGNVKMARPL